MVQSRIREEMSCTGWGWVRGPLERVPRTICCLVRLDRAVPMNSLDAGDVDVELELL